MRQAALKPVWKRKFIHTTDSGHDLPIATDILSRVGRMVYLAMPLPKKNATCDTVSRDIYYVVFTHISKGNSCQKFVQWLAWPA